MIGEAVSEGEIDKLVESQADADSAWEKPTEVKRQEEAAAQHERAAHKGRTDCPAKK